MGPCASLLTCPLSDVLRKGLRVDLNALCDFVERLSCLFIVAYRVNIRGMVHDITLPRSWFINLIPPGTDLKMDTSSLVKFASATIELMQRIDAKARQDLTPVSDTEDQSITDGARQDPAPASDIEDQSTADGVRQDPTPASGTEDKSIADDAQQDPTPASDTEDQFIADSDRTIDFMGPLYIVRM